MAVSILIPEASLKNVKNPYRIVFSSKGFLHLPAQKTNHIMKKTFLILSTVLMTVFAFGQTAPQLPDFKMVPALVKPDGSLDKLEKATSEIKSKTKGFSYGASVVQFINILGGHSPVKIKATDAVFIIKMPDAETDPETAFYLTKVTVAKNTRELELAQSAAAMASAFGGKGKSVKRDDVKLDFEKVAPGVYKFKPVTPLAPGTEYGFVNTSSGGASNSTVFCFATN